MNIKDLEKLYDERVKSLPNSWESCGWGDEDEQLGRYMMMGSVIPAGVNVLDVGCGEADFGVFLSTRKITENYTGIDISGEMLRKAAVKCPTGKFIKTSLDDYCGTAFDVVTAIGTFNVIADVNQYEYLEKQLRNCFEKSNIGVFVSLSVNTQGVGVPEDSVIFWYDVIKLHELVRKITPFYVFNTASAAMETLVWMYRG